MLWQNMAIYNVAEYTGDIVVFMTSMHYPMVVLHKKLYENTEIIYALHGSQWLTF